MDLQHPVLSISPSDCIFDRLKTINIIPVVVKKPAAGSEQNFAGGYQTEKDQKNAGFHSRHNDKRG